GEEEANMIFAWLVTLFAGAVLLGSRAVANGYLVVLRSRRHGLVVLERRADERYHAVALSSVAIALLRYLALNVAYSLLLLRERLPTVGGARKTVPLAAKA